MSDLYLEMKTFCTLLSLYESQLTNCEWDHFPTLIERTTSDPKATIKSRMGKYVTVIKSLKAECDRRFEDFAKVGQQIKLFVNPFTVEINEVEKRLQVELDTMQCNFSLENRFKQLSLHEFHTSLDKVRFPMVRSQSKRMMSQFGSTFANKCFLL